MSDALAQTIAYLADQLSPTQGRVLTEIMDGTYQPVAGDGVTSSTLDKVARMGLLQRVSSYRGELTSIGRLVAERYQEMIDNA